MNRSAGLLLLFVAVTLNGAEIKVEAGIQPEAAAPGDSVRAWVEFTGADSLTQVVLIPREYAYEINEPFPLRKDEACGKERWIIQTKVPYDAPYGAINLEVRALDKNGHEIVVDEFKEQQFGKAGLLKFKVR